MIDLQNKGMSIVKLDLTKDYSIVNCVNTIIEKEGRIDISINNAVLWNLWSH